MFGLGENGRENKIDLQELWVGNIGELVWTVHRESLKEGKVIIRRKEYRHGYRLMPYWQEGDGVELDEYSNLHRLMEWQIRFDLQQERTPGSLAHV